MYLKIQVSSYVLTIIQDIPAFHVAAGNPARVIRRIETDMDPSQKKE